MKKLKKMLEGTSIFLFLRALRFFLVIGPLRSYWIGRGRKKNNGKNIINNDDLFTCEKSLQELTDILEKDGVSEGVCLSDQYIEGVSKYYFESTPGKGTIYNPHEKCSMVEAIALNHVIIDVARKYFGNEPILLASKMWLSEPKAGNDITIHAERFHFDVADCKSLVVFIYLTDVDDECGPHVVIKGTHKNKKIKDFFRLYMEDSVADTLHAGNIKVITGKKGTTFFEEQTILHKAKIARKPRLILGINYSLTRKAITD